MEEEKEGCSGKDLQERKVLAWNERVRWWWNTDNNKCK